jgi:hypothetical protein
MTTNTQDRDLAAIDDADLDAVSGGSGDGRLVVAAYGDGTIRWHRVDDGRELLALSVLADKQNWVAWCCNGR